MKIVTIKECGMNPCADVKLNENDARIVSRFEELCEILQDRHEYSLSEALGCKLNTNKGDKTSVIGFRYGLGVKRISTKQTDVASNLHTSHAAIDVYLEFKRDAPFIPVSVVVNSGIIDAFVGGFDLTNTYLLPLDLLTTQLPRLAAIINGLYMLQVNKVMSETDDLSIFTKRNDLHLPTLRKLLDDIQEPYNIIEIDPIAKFERNQDDDTINIKVSAIVHETKESEGYFTTILIPLKIYLDELFDGLNIQNYALKDL